MRLIFDIASKRGVRGTENNRRLAARFKAQIEESFRQRGRIQNCSVEVVEGLVNATKEMCGGDVLILFSKRNLPAARAFKKANPEVRVVVLTELLFEDRNEVVVVDMFWLDCPRSTTKHLIPQN